ncbi:DUF1294 domain-containing protein [Bacillus sp. FJAT-29953]|nr:DUF1294 domain-containing protein [Bacillus sp. FJAT-29953]
MNGLWLVIAIINIYAFILMGVDKSKARKHQYRIRERTLWLAALFGGAVGATVGMYFFRHKTKHLQFKIGFPILAIIDVILYIKGVI